MIQFDSILLSNKYGPAEAISNGVIERSNLQTPSYVHVAIDCRWVRYFTSTIFTFGLTREIIIKAIAL